MNTPKLCLTLLTSALFIGNDALAHEPTCYDNARTRVEAERCDNALVTPLQDNVEAEFKRVTNKFKGNSVFLEMLNAAKQDWDGYINVQCLVDASAAAGGQTMKPLPIESIRAWGTCLHRIYSSRLAELQRL